MDNLQTNHIYKVKQLTLSIYQNNDLISIIDYDIEYICSFSYKSYIRQGIASQSFRTIEKIETLDNDFIIEKLNQLYPINHNGKLTTKDYQSFFNYIVNFLPENDSMVNERLGINYLINKITIGGILFTENLFNEKQEFLNYLNQINLTNNFNKNNIDNQKQQVKNSLINKNQNRYSISGVQEKHLTFIHNELNANKCNLNIKSFSKLFPNFIVKKNSNNEKFPFTSENEFVCTNIAQSLSNYAIEKDNLIIRNGNNNLTDLNNVTTIKDILIKRFDVHYHFDKQDNQDLLIVNFDYMIDLCQLLGESRNNKYDLFEYETIKKLNHYLDNDNITELYKRTIINILLLNDDNHLKNTSVFYQAPMTYPKSQNKYHCILTPVYDVLCTSIYFDFPNNPLTYYHSDDINDLFENQNKEVPTFFCDVNYDYLVNLGLDFNLEKQQSSEIVNQILNDLNHEMQKYLNIENQWIKRNVIDNITHYSSKIKPNQN